MNIYLNGLNNQTSKRSNVYRNHVGVYNTTPTGSHLFEPFFFYKHQIPLGFFPKHTQSTLKRSNIYSNLDIVNNTTPTGSHLTFFYNHSIPSGFFPNILQFGLNRSNLNNDIVIPKKTTSKRSNVYRKNVCERNTTPSGSHIFEPFFFYKYQIPSGFIGNHTKTILNRLYVYINSIFSKKTTSKRSNVYRNHVGVGDTTPTGSHIPQSFIFYNHSIPSGF